MKFYFATMLKLRANGFLKNSFDNSLLDVIILTKDGFSVAKKSGKRVIWYHPFINRYIAGSGYVRWI